MAGNNIAINIQIKNIKAVSDLKKSIKDLRKEQRDYEKQLQQGVKKSEAQAKGYVKNEKAIRKQSTALRETKKELNGVANAQKKTTKGGNSLSRSFVKAAAAIAVVVAAFRILSNALSGIVSTFTEFEFVMAKVQAVSGATDEEFKKLTSSAEALGRSTFFTASQVGELQLAYSKLGFTADEILNAQKATLDLATATGTDLARAAQVAGASIRGFQIDAEDAGRVVDVMAVAFSSSALDIEKWNTSMTKVAPIAAMAGFSIEETAAIMGKLTDTGIEASIAGTSLRNILLKMQDPSSELSKRLGHTVTNLDEMLESFKQLQDEGTDLTDVLGFMDVRQVAAFGTMLKGSDDIRELRDSLLEANGEGERMAGVVGDTLQGAFLKFKSAMEGTAIALMKHFGEGLKQSVVKMAKFLNSFVKSEGAIKKFVKQVKNVVTGIKWIISILGFYVIGAKATALYTYIINSSFVTLMFSATGAAGAVTALSASLVVLKRALISTGIGALVVFAGYLINKFLEAGDAAVYLADREDKVNDAMDDTQVKISSLKKSLDSLTQTRAKMEKMMKKEGDGLKDNAVLTEKYNRLKKQEAIDIKAINKHMKTYNKELVNEKDNIKDIKIATNELITAMKNKALATVFIDMQAVILKTKVESDIVLDKMKKYTVPEDAYGGGSADKFGSKNINTIIKHVEEGVKDRFGIVIGKSTRYGSASNLRKERLEALLEDYGITISEFKAAIAGGYYDSEMKELTRIIESQSKTNIIDLLIDTDADADGEGLDFTGSVDAVYEMNEKIQAALLAANVNAIKNEDDKQKAILRAQLKGVNEYMAQFKSAQDRLKPEYISAANTRSKLLRQQEKLLFNIEQKAIEDRRSKAKQGAVDLLLDKTKTNKEVEVMVEGEATKIILTAANLNDTLNKMDVAANAELLANATKYKQDLNQIQQQITAQSIKNKKDNMAASITTLEKVETEDTSTLDKMLALDQITEAQHNQYMLQLQRSYLNDKLAILNTYSENVDAVTSELAENEIDQIYAQKEALAGYIDTVSSLGDNLQALAGDEENMSGIREAGIKITQAAALAEQILALKTMLSAVAKNQDNLASTAALPIKALSTTANTIEGTSALVASGGYFTAAVAKGMFANPFAGLAILAAVIGIVATLRSMFKGTTTGSDGSGGSDDFSSADRASDGVYSYSAGAYEDGGIIPEYEKGGITNEGGGTTRNVMGMEIPTIGGGVEGSDSGGGRTTTSTSGINRPSGDSRENKGGYWTSREDAWKFKGGVGTEMDSKSSQCGKGYVYNKATGRCVKDNRILWEYRGGGLVRGKSHAQGGEKFSVGGRVSELEGGEAVINRRSTKMFKSQLSAINQAGGGVKFADGGITSKMKYADGGLLNSPAFAQQKFSGEAKDTRTSQRVYVVEADISNSQRSVTVLEANATI